MWSKQGKMQPDQTKDGIKCVCHEDVVPQQVGLLTDNEAFGSEQVGRLLRTAVSTA